MEQSTKPSTWLNTPSKILCLSNSTQTREPPPARSPSQQCLTSPVDLNGRNIVSGKDGMGVLPPLFDAPTSNAREISGPTSDFGQESEVYGRTSGILFHKLLLDTLLPGYQCLAQGDPSLPSQANGSIGHPLRWSYCSSSNQTPSRFPGPALLLSGAEGVMTNFARKGW
jgi:hypothetical protein